MDRRVAGWTDGQRDEQRDGWSAGGQTGLSTEMRLGLVNEYRKLTPEFVLEEVWFRYFPGQGGHSQAQA